MKKMLWALMSLMLLFTGCSNDDDLGLDSSQQATSRKNHFYGVKSVENDLQTKGVAQLSKLWYPGTTIKVRFLGGTSALQLKVRTYAAIWEQHANIKFQFITSGEADVRVGFDWNNDRYITWSYTGTDCKKVTDQNEATMSFADLEFASEEEVKGDVLRAFGQVLGLELEHRHTNFDAGWTDRIAEFWEGDIEDIPWETLKKYVFDPLLASEVIQTSEYDPTSIMVWPIPRKYAQNAQRNWNFDLSTKDISFIKTVYPQGGFGDPAIITMKTTKKDISFMIDNRSDIVVDWGDGKLQSYPGYEGTGYKYNTCEHSYQYNGTRTIKIYGRTDKVRSIHCQDNEIIELDISKNTILEAVNCQNNRIKELDVSNNLMMTYIYARNNQIRELNISRHTELRGVDCGYNNISKLDVGKSLKITSVRCHNNPIISDRLAMIALAESLPVNTAYSAYIMVNDQTTRDWIFEICRAKRWSVSY